MKYGTYIFFAVFSGLGGLFIWKFAPETKDKTLEELDIFFGGSKESIAEADRLRMERINDQLGLGGVENLEDLNTEKQITTQEQMDRMIFVDNDLLTRKRRDWTMQWQEIMGA